jgi:DNA-binding NarL/FixJ family response regulator
MDLSMPRVDGLAAMELLRQQPRPPEVIVAVGHGKSNAEIATELFMSVARVPTAGKARRGGTGFRSLYSSKRRGSIGPISPR